MSRTRALITTAALAAGLVAPLAATATAAEAAPTRTVVRTVSYGDKPVTVPKGKRLALRFEGRRGDLVTLSGVSPARIHLVLSGPRRRQLDAGWDDSGVFRLPRTGTYTFRVGPQRYATQTVGLLKVRVHAVEVDGAVRVPKSRRGYIDMASVRLDGGDRVTVDDGRELNLVYGPGHTFGSFSGEHVLLRPGHRVLASDDSYSTDLEAAAGTTLLRVRSGHRVTVASAVDVTAQPDGPQVTVAPERRMAREYVVGLDGSADDLVYLDTVSGPGLAEQSTQLDRWETPVDTLVSGVRPVSPSLVLPTTGHHEISTVTTAVGGSTPAVTRLRKGIRVAALTPDGPAVDLAFDGSGTRLYSLATAAGLRLEATSEVPPGQAWKVEMGPSNPSTCGADPYGPLGCGENGFIAVSDTRPTGTSTGFSMPDPVVVAIPAPGTTGTVHLRLFSRAVG